MSGTQLAVVPKEPLEYSIQLRVPYQSEAKCFEMIVMPILIGLGLTKLSGDHHDVQ